MGVSRGFLWVEYDIHLTRGFFGNADEGKVIPALDSIRCAV